ncbi:hypothetical protein AYO44_00935 [Planctomycetaceae bacterium SCGC AG-212-F19]|nr:hypothetical protein AYO44_00935 [Planctomycetaceae bacterium SCGC AG-212-F19]
MRLLGLCLVTAGLAVAPALAQDKPSANWDAPLCKPVDRVAVYEFTRAPVVKKVAPDRFDIAFAVKDSCDVAVAVESPDGRIVRHIGYGVLGANAPAPFKKDALEQTLSWDGKDEFGKYVPNTEQCRVRVSLGLNPTFDKVIGWHPHNTANTRNVTSIAADANGVYVLECLEGGHNQLRHFDHDGNYVKTLYPWDPDQLDHIGIPKRTLRDTKIHRDAAPPAGSPYAPVLTGYGSTMPFDAIADRTCMAAAGGKIGIYTRGGFGDVRRLLRVRSDGTTGGEPVEGPILSDKANGPFSYQGQAHMTLSPDGQWVYVTGLYRKSVEWRNGLLLPGYGETAPCRWNAVYRFAWDARGPVIDGQDAHIGEVSRDMKKAGADNDNTHLNGPQGLACDAAGRLHVADFGNHRIQVFSPEGKHLKTIPVQEPQEIAVHPKTGEIYVLSFRKTGHGVPKGPITLAKFGPFTEPTARLRQTFPVEGDEFVGSIRVTPVMALDGWAPEPRLWLLHKQGVVRVYADKGKELTLVRDFEEDVRKARHTPHAMPGGYMSYMTVDPRRGHVYRGMGNLMRIDPEEGKTWEGLDLRSTFYGLGGAQETVFGWDGLMYVRTLRTMARFSPDKFKKPIVLNADCEVPFDYGEATPSTDRRGGEPAAKLNGILSFPWALGGPNGYNNGIGISPRGDVLILIENFQDFEAWRKLKLTNSYIDDSVWKPFLKDMENRYRPTQFPGRSWAHGHLVWRYSSTGQVAAIDAVPGLPYSSFGIRTDAAGNFFTGVGYHMNVDGKPHIGGSLAKFAPKGGRLIRDFNTPVKLEDLPKRPPDFLSGGRIWGQNMFWAAPGMDQLHFVDEAGTGYPCECYHCKFDTDVYGRSFLPRAYAYHVAVLDTNGNRICTIGRFGNPDKPAMKPGDTDIGLGQCSYLATVSDKWLYIADDSNMRIIRVKLGYHTEQRVAIGGP